MSTKTMRPPPRRGLSAPAKSAAAGGSVNTIPNINIIARDSNSNVISNKRKERDESFSVDRVKSKTSTVQPAGTGGAAPRIYQTNAPNHIGSKPGPSTGTDSGRYQPANQGSQLLLAGYLAYEFISKGTLFGETWDPTRSDPNQYGLNEPVAEDGRSVTQPCCGGEGPDTKPVEQQKRNEPEEKEEGRRRYETVSNLLMSGGVHLPGIFNPSQLRRFLQL